MRLKPPSVEGLTMEEALAAQMKFELRKRMRNLRAAAAASACAERSERIVERLVGDHRIAVAKSVGLFWPIERFHEVDLRPLDASLRARGARVAYPAIDADSRVMRFCFVDDHADLVERGMGFCEPGDDALDCGALDVIVLPALALDGSGNRIGYGAGHYDRTMPRYAPPAHLLAVAFDYQVVIEIPHAPHDVRVDAVVTDERTLECRPTSPELPQLR